MKNSTSDFLFPFAIEPDVDCVLELNEEIQIASNVECARFGFHHSKERLISYCAVQHCIGDAMVLEGRIIHPCDKYWTPYSKDKISAEMRIVLSGVRAKIMLCDEHFIQQMVRHYPNIDPRYFEMKFPTYCTSN